jgi:tRNA-splicing ligase RtcB
VVVEWEDVRLISGRTPVRSWPTAQQVVQTDREGTMGTSNCDIIKTGRGNIIKAWTRGVPVEQGAREQLKKTADLPFIYKWVAAMPDVHFGMGATVGSVIATDGAIVPAAVGVDIGCGMTAVQTHLEKKDIGTLETLRERIERAVPHGRTHNGGPGDRGSWGTVPDDVLSHWEGLLLDGFKRLVEHDGGLNTGREVAQLGTLGTGNHFIEVSTDEAGVVWLMLHSGSRGIGNRIGTYFIRHAKQLMARYFIDLADQNLAYIPEKESDDALFSRYMAAAKWAQEYARVNRRLMMRKVLAAVGLGEYDHVPEWIDCHHNYVEKEKHFGKLVWVTRKGATRAGIGEHGIIPGAMGRQSFIVKGRGNPESFKSCSHGAGRLMSRTDARRQFSVRDHELATQGLACRKDGEMLDETPGAYKDIDAVMHAQRDLVEIEHTLKALICVKG